MSFKFYRIIFDLFNFFVQFFRICRWYIIISIYTLLICLLYPINIKTAEPIGPKFCVGPHVAREKFMKDQNLKNLPSSKLDFNSIFKKIKIRACSSHANILILLMQRSLNITLRHHHLQNEKLLDK